MVLIAENKAESDSGLKSELGASRRSGPHFDQHQLALTLGCNAVGRTVLQRRYMAYPLSVSPVFRLDGNGSGGDFSRGSTVKECVDKAQRAYLYRMNTSPGLLAGDRLSLSLCLDAGSSLCLLDQAATKVHTMSAAESARAQVRYEVEVGDRATLEFLPKPLILYADSALTQTTDLSVHPTAGLSWGEIILPGRLARGEVYDFREYWSQIKVRSPGGNPWFIETMKLLGKGNRFADCDLFASGPVLGTLLLVLPGAITSSENLTLLSQQIDGLSTDSLNMASSVLPGERGLFVRAIAHTTREMQASFKTAANHVRKLRHQYPLPYSL